MKTLSKFIQEALTLSDYTKNKESQREEYLRSILGDEQYLLKKLGEFNVDNFLKIGINVERDRMPQIPDDELDTFLMHFSNKYGVKKLRVPLSKLKATQNEINLDKVKDMIRSKSDRWQTRKYLVSNDWHLADGHHDCVCGLVHDPEHVVTVYRVNLHIEKLLTILRKMKITKFKDINDKTV